MEVNNQPLNEPISGQSVERDERLPEAPTIKQIVNAALRLQPKEAMSRLNGDRASRCLLGPITAITDEPGQEHSLKTIDGRYGVGLIRVSTVKQRSHADSDTISDLPSAVNEGFDRVRSTISEELDADAEAMTREEMQGKLADTSYSERDQIERASQYFISRGEAFYIASDAGLSGAWPWYDPSLITSLVERKARRYSRAFTRLVIENPKYAEHIETTKAYLADKIIDIVACASELNEQFKIKYLGDNAETRRRTVAKYRPGLTAVVDRLSAIHTIAVADLTRLCRSYEIQIDLGRLLAKYATGVVGIIDPIFGFDLDSDEDSEISNAVMGVVMGKMAEGYLRTVLNNTMKGQLGAIDAGKIISMPPKWLTKTRNGQIVIDPVIGPLALELIAEYEAGAGPDHLGALAWERHNYRMSRGTAALWIRSTLLVGDISQYGIMTKGAAPALLTDVHGKPDYERFHRIERNIAARRGNQEYGRGFNSPNHLGTGLMRCVCGRTARAWAIGKDRLGEPTYWYRCAATAGEMRKNPHKPIMLHYGNVNNFLSDMIDDNLEQIMGELRGGVSRDILMEAVTNLEARRQETEARIAAIKRERYEEAVTKADEITAGFGGKQDKDLVANLLRLMTGRDAEELADVETQLKRQREVLDALEHQPKLSDLDRIQSGFREAGSIRERNTLMRSILELRFTRVDDSQEDDALECHIHLKVARAQPIPVPLSLKRTGRGLTIRLPENARHDLITRIERVT